MRAIRAVVATAAVAFVSVAFAGEKPKWAPLVPKGQGAVKSPLNQSAPEVIAGGKEVFTNTCQICHGPNAQGDGPSAQFLNPKPLPLVVDGKLPLPDGVMFWVITNGIPDTGMASLNEALNETERWQAIAYLHSMAGDLAPAATPTPAAAASPAETPATKEAASTPAPAASPKPTGKKSASKDAPGAK